MTLETIIPKELGLPAKYTQWRTDQGDCVDRVVGSGKKVFLLDAPTGCHAKGQLILMHDGTTKTVENIIVGDQLMGPDSLPREVLRLYRGTETMVNIVPAKGEQFRVNVHHILSLKITKGVYKPNFRPDGRRQYTEGSHKGSGIYGGLKNCQIIDIPILEYLEKARWFRHIAKLYRVPIQFNNYFSRGEFALPITPYFLGVLLGDGGLKGTISVTSSFNIPEMYDEALRFRVRVMPNGNRGKAKTWNLTIPKGGTAKNPLRETLKEMGLLGTGAGTKFIPQAYKLASIGDRLEILAGLMDTDGSVSGSGYDYSSKSSQLAGDVAFIARSVGLAAYISPCLKICQTGAVGKYYRVSISGDCSIIPARHRPTLKRKQKKDCLVTGFKITLSKPDNFYGFNLSGDGRYLLNDFTVTHNSGKSLVGIASYKRLNIMDKVLDRMTDEEQKYRCLYLTKTIQLQEQILGDFPAAMIKGRKNYPCSQRAGDFPSFSAEDCPGSCSDFCAYVSAKKFAVASPLAALNDAYYLSEVNGPKQFSGANMVILDEIDSLESCLMDFVKFSVSERQCKKYGLLPPVHLDNLAEWIKWAYNAASVVSKGIELLKTQLTFNDVEHWTNTDIEINKDIKRGEQFLHQMSGFMADVNETWILDYEYKKQGWMVTFKPVTVGPYCERYLWRHGKRFLGMSGTILDPEIMAEDLGIEEYEYHRLDSNFPVQNRLIHVKPTCNLKFDIMQQELPKLTEEVARLINLYPGENTLVHAVSNNIRDHLVNSLPWAGVNPEIIMTHDKDNRADQLELFKNMRGCVMISPSFDRGVDLPNDECRSVIICKMPYMNLSDKQVKARMAMPKGQRWYNLRAIQSVMQMTGRAVRSKDDYCDCWILDSQFDRLLARTRHLIPKWWLDAIRREPCKQ